MLAQLFHVFIPAAAIALAAACATAQERAANGPSTQPADYLIGEMHQQTLPSINYFYLSMETTFDKLQDAIGKLMPQFEKPAAEGKVKLNGGPVFIYRDVKDMSQPFTLEIGFAVAADTRAFGDFKIRKTDPFHCATLLYTGSLAHIKDAHEKLYSSLFAAGLTPTGESREAYLYWEGPDSANDVVQIQAGVR